MKIPVNLNEEQTVLDAIPSEPLLNVLRRMGIFSVKCGCQDGFCGNCMVLLNGKPVPSCQIPCGIVRDNKVITLEFFTNPKKKEAVLNEDPKAKKPSSPKSTAFTEDDFLLYKDILSGFSEAVRTMNPGSRITAWIHPDLGYGENAGDPVGPQSLLIFDIELVSFENPDAVAEDE